MVKRKLINIKIFIPVKTLHNMFLAALIICFSFHDLPGKNEERKSDVLQISDLGLYPNTNEDATPFLIKAIEICKKEKKHGLKFLPGRYDFYPENSRKEELFISAHDHIPTRNIGIYIRDMEGFTLDGSSSDFVFHGSMLPISLIDNKYVTLKNFSIDFEKPHFSQAYIKTVMPEYIDILFPDDVNYNVKNHKLYLESDLGELEIQAFMEFDTKNKFIIWNSGDFGGYEKVESIKNNEVRIYGIKRKVQQGNTLFMRNTSRPNPGILSWRCVNVKMENIDIHWAQGMGTLSQRCENITMDRVNVRLKEESNRFFTTVDALHFTACKGIVSVCNGIYENMQDDAINIHGDYLQIQEIAPERTRMVIVYKHPQSFGYEAVLDGEAIQLIDSETMLPLSKTKVQKSNRIDDYHIEIFCEDIVPDEVTIGDCIENIEWVPEVVYKNNIIKNNRARGALFSTPQKIVVENNYFEQCSGSAILFSSDCNSWFLSGACHHVIIKNNHFNLCMTSKYQYCEGIISIYPEIKKDAVNQYYHSNISIMDNKFTAIPGAILVYAKSVDGITIKLNRLQLYSGENNSSYEPLKFTNCKEVEVKRNKGIKK